MRNCAFKSIPNHFHEDEKEKNGLFVTCGDLILATIEVELQHHRRGFYSLDILHHRIHRRHVDMRGNLRRNQHIGHRLIAYETSISRCRE